MKTYVVADLHGRRDLLDAAILRIEADAGSGRVVFLGDYIDRGPQSRQVIERLIAGPEDLRRWRWTCLRGNHEDLMLWAVEQANAIGWLQNGGGPTLISYGQHPGDRADLSVLPEAHLNWAALLPTLLVDRHRVFVHAGVDPTLPLDAQTDHVLTWKLYPDAFAEGHCDRHVVHGHHQHADGPKLFSGRTALDTFAWATGRLVVAVFDDDRPGGPIDIIEILGEPDRHWTRTGERR